MNDKQSIIGFTEAELGLFVAILVFIIAGLKYQAPSTATSKSNVSPTSSPTADIPRLNRKLQKENQDLRARLDAFEKTRQALRSHATPTCKEKGLAKGPLFDVTITGRDSFQVGSKDLDFDALIDSFGLQIDAAETAGCKHTVRVFYGPGVTAPDYVAAKNELGQEFYPTDSGPRP